MGVSKNNGTPKSSILIGFSIIYHPFWRLPPIFGNTQMHHFWFIRFWALNIKQIKPPQAAATTLRIEVTCQKAQRVKFPVCLQGNDCKTKRCSMHVSKVIKTVGSRKLAPFLSCLFLLIHLLYYDLLNFTVTLRVNVYPPNF